MKEEEKNKNTTEIHTHTPYDVKRNSWLISLKRLAVFVFCPHFSPSLASEGISQYNILKY